MIYAKVQAGPGVESGSLGLPSLATVSGARDLAPARSLRRECLEDQLAEGRRLAISDLDLRSMNIRKL
jgi:hypothetical protein